MSGIGTWLWGTSQLDDAIDKATSELLPSGAEDIALNLEICDQIRSKSVPAKDAMRAIKRRLNHKNPNVQLLALGLTDICIKNGGDHFLTEVASREFMDNLVSILKIPTLNIEVKNAILRLIQNWSIAFEGKSSLSYVEQVYKALNNEGYKFPPKDLIVANSAMVDTQTAPEWIDSDVCLRCRTPFSFTNRKHHCRNCGQVFDQQCSAKSMPLPHFGITQDVRVCDNCHPKLIKKNEKPDKGHRHSTSLHGARHRSARELADAELQRAIQLSLQEVGSANGHARPGYVPAQPSPSPWQYSEPPIVDRSTHPPSGEEEDDPDLKAAIEASLREANAPKPSAPIVVDTPRQEERQFSYEGPGYSQSYPPGLHPQASLPNVPNYDLEPLESDVILTFSQTVEQVQAQGGRDMSRYPAVNELYDKANSLRPKLALNLDDVSRKEQMLSDMHDKLSQAVKLYDQLLTEQVSHPRWRSPPSTSNTSPAYQMAPTQNAGYSQWVPQQRAGSVSYQSTGEMSRQPQSQMAYSSITPTPTHEQRMQYTSASHTESSQPQWHQRPESSQYSQHASQSIQYSSASPQGNFMPQSPQAEYQQYAAANSSPSHTLPPMSYNSEQPPLSTPSAPPFQSTPNMHYMTSPNTALPHSPPLMQYGAPPDQPVVQQSQVSPSLTRHQSVTYSTSASSPPAQNLSRSHTVAHAPAYAHQPPLRQPLQSQQISSPPPSSVLPQFPVAPTSAPQSFPMYGPSIPSGVAQIEERKEALLIDL